MNLPLHGAHVGAPKFTPIALEPQTAHSRSIHHDRAFVDESCVDIGTVRFIDYRVK
jgi:hypothetical protein